MYALFLSRYKESVITITQPKKKKKKYYFKSIKNFGPKSHKSSLVCRQISRRGMRHIGAVYYYVNHPLMYVN